MKKNIVFIALLWALTAQAQDFYAVTPSGHRLYYSITSVSEHTVSVVDPVNVEYEEYSFYSSQFWEHDVDLVIPDTVHHNGVAYLVTGIGSQALNIPMHSLTIPRSMRTIGYHAFASPGSDINNYSVKNNTMRVLYFNADSLEYSGGLWTAYNYWMPAMEDCMRLDTVYVGEHVKYLPKKLFADCDSLRCVVMGDSVHTVDSGAFGSSPRIDSVRVSPSLRVLGASAFAAAAIQRIDLPDGLQYIGGGAFAQCHNLVEIMMPNTVDYLGHSCFFSCTQLQHVRLSNSLTRLPNDCFSYCSVLSDMDFGTGLEVIGEMAFYQCQSLTDIDLPASLDTLMEMCFSVCPIASVTLRSTTPPVTVNRVFSYSQSNAIPVYIPCGTLAAYQVAPTWSNFTNLIETMPYTLTVMSDDETMGSAEVTSPGTCTDPAVITALPTQGFRFVSWNDGDITNPRSVMLTHDTVFTALFEALDGINEVDGSAVTVWTQDGRIVVAGADGMEVCVYDMLGRHVRNEALPNGVYMVRVGTLPAKKVIVYGSNR